MVEAQRRRSTHAPNQDLKENGTAIPGYFHLLKYYLFFVVLVIGVNALYPIYATFYACRELDTQDNYCLKVGVLYYLEYRSMVQLLQAHNETHMIYVLVALSRFWRCCRPPSSTCCWGPTT